MMRPVTVRLQFSCSACCILRPDVVACLFQSEAVERLHDSEALLCLGPAWQSASRSVAGPVKTSKVPVHLQRCHMCNEVEGMAHEMTVKDCDRRGPVTFDSVR